MPVTQTNNDNYNLIIESNFNKSDKDLRNSMNSRKNKFVWRLDTDFRWSSQESRQSTGDRISKPQTIILEEYQPGLSYDWGPIIGLIGGLIPTDAIVKIAAAAGAKKALDELYTKIQTTLNAEKKDFCVELVRNLFNATKLGAFVMPFFNDIYLDANSNDGWSCAGSARLLGDDLAKSIKENLSIDFPTTPSWSVNDKGQDFNYEFYLINDSSDDLVKNHRFLNRWISGNYWLQMGFMQKSPNVYKVTVPGRFRKYFCSAGTKVTCVGKLRQASPDIISRMMDTQPSLEDGNMSDSQEGNDFTPMFPDAWKIEISIKDLTPNNFNLYVDYLLNGRFNPGSDTDYQVLTNVINEVGNIIKGVLPG